MRDGASFRPTELNLLCNRGGLGDSVARLPAVAYILKQYPHVTKVRLIVQDYFVEVATMLLRSDRVEVYGYSKMREVLETYKDTPGMMVDSKHHTTLHTHLTDHAFHTLVDEQVDEVHKQYLQFDFGTTMPGKEVVITTGFTSPTREWLPAYVNEVAHWVRAQGYGVTFLGKKENEHWKDGPQSPIVSTFRDEIDYSLGLDLRDKTTLVEAAQIMHRAAAVVGIDNGLLHLAACTQVPIVFGITTLKPEHRMPYRENVYLVTPPRELKCRFCQSKMNYVYEFDYRTCYFGDYECVKKMEARPFIQELKYALQIK